MDETEYKAFHETINERPCLFEIAILGGCYDCVKARRLNLAEREAVACLSQTAWERCQTALNLLYDKARFALRQAASHVVLSHAQKKKVQCGGLIGLQAFLNKRQSNDIHELLTETIEHLTCSENTGFHQEIIQCISHYKVRRPH